LGFHNPTGSWVRFCVNQDGRSTMPMTPPTRCSRKDNGLTVTSLFRPFSGYLPQLLAMAVVYFISGWLSLMVSQDSHLVTVVIFTAEGFALAGMLLVGYRLWPGIFVGQLALALWMGTPVLVALAIAAGNAAEGMLAVWLFRRLRLDRRLATLRDIVGLVLLITLVLQPFSALIGNLALLAGSLIDWSHFPVSLFSWWFGNSMGQLLVTPLVLLLYVHRHRTRLLELSFIAMAFALLTYLLQVTLAVHHVSLLILVSVLAVVWLAIRDGVLYGLFATAVVAVVSVVLAHMGQGSLATATSLDHLIDLNFFLLAHILLVLIIGTLFHEKEAALRELAIRANQDMLTGLPNRNQLTARVGEAIGRATHCNELSAICFIDVDGFKAVNDTLGHRAGDEVLKTVALRIGQMMNEEDVLLRLGGDEFLLICNRLPGRSVVEVVLTRICESVGKGIDTSAGEARVSLSIGVALCRDDAFSEAELVENAD